MVTRCGGVMRPNPKLYLEFGFGYKQEITALNGSSGGRGWHEEQSVYNNAHGYCNPSMTQLAWPRHKTLATSIQSKTLQLKGQTANTKASPNASYRQETSKCSAEDRVGSRGSLSSPQSSERSESPALNELRRSACQLDARKTTHYFLLHHQTVAHSWRPSAGSFPAQTPTFQGRFVGAYFPVFDRCWCSSH